GSSRSKMSSRVRSSVDIAGHRRLPKPSMEVVSVGAATHST
ncbi:hypothetical protein NPIL_504911, partial [Nephila pilipes]